MWVKSQEMMRAIIAGFMFGTPLAAGARATADAPTHVEILAQFPYGSRPVPVGDIDADGWIDLVFSTRDISMDSSNRANAIDCLSSRTGTSLWTFDRPVHDGLGCGVAPAGDINHDGILDVIVGQAVAGQQAAASESGRVHLLSGMDGAVIATWSPDAGKHAYGNAVYELTGRDATGSPVGESLSGVVWARSDERGMPGIDLVCTRSGRTLWAQAWNIDWTFALQACRVDSLALPNDGYIAVGVPLARIARSSSFGAVYLYDISGALSLVIPPQSETDYRGSAMRTVGDINGDGVTDIVTCFIEQVTSGARVVLLSGSSGDALGVCRVSDASTECGSDIGVVRRTAYGPEQLVIVGDPGASRRSGLGSGSLYAVQASGAGLGKMTRLELAVGPASRLGEVVSCVGDINGNGYEDFAVGSNVSYCWDPSVPDATYVVDGEALWRTIDDYGVGATEGEDSGQK